MTNDQSSAVACAVAVRAVRNCVSVVQSLRVRCRVVSCCVCVVVVVVFVVVLTADCCADYVVYSLFTCGWRLAVVVQLLLAHVSVGYEIRRYEVGVALLGLVGISLVQLQCCVRSCGAVQCSVVPCGAAVASGTSFAIRHLTTTSGLFPVRVVSCRLSFLSYFVYYKPTTLQLYSYTAFSTIDIDGTETEYRITESRSPEAKIVSLLGLGLGYGTGDTDVASLRPAAATPPLCQAPVGSAVAQLTDWQMVRPVVVATAFHSQWGA